MSAFLTITYLSMNTILFYKFFFYASISLRVHFSNCMLVSTFHFMTCITLYAFLPKDFKFVQSNFLSYRAIQNTFEDNNNSKKYIHFHCMIKYSSHTERNYYYRVFIWNLGKLTVYYRWLYSLIWAKT